MAYVIGLASKEEIAELKRRGWDIETPPAKLFDRDTLKMAKEDGLQPVQIWVDASLFEVMNGPDWDKGASEKPAVD